MPDFNRLHELARRLAELTASGAQEPGLHTWCMFVAEDWKQIAEMWEDPVEAVLEEKRKMPGEETKWPKGLERIADSLGRLVTAADSIAMALAMKSLTSPRSPTGADSYSECPYCKYLPSAMTSEPGMECGACRRIVQGTFFTPDRRPGDPNAR